MHPSVGDVSGIFEVVAEGRCATPSVLHGFAGFTAVPREVKPPEAGDGSRTLASKETQRVDRCVGQPVIMLAPDLLVCTSTPNSVAPGVMPPTPSVGAECEASTSRSRYRTSNQLQLNVLNIPSPKRNRRLRSSWEAFLPYYAGYPETFAHAVLARANLPKTRWYSTRGTGAEQRPTQPPNLGLFRTVLI